MGSVARKRFDLNMEEDLNEAWGRSDAIRELIANALDEQILTGSDEIEIFEDDTGRWHIRDYGRGLRYQNFTQGENPEKLDNPDKVIGKFGVGLKDALAVLYRHGVTVTIQSPHNLFTVEEGPKAEFEDVTTLHTIVEQSDDPNRSGTNIILEGCTAQDIEAAKAEFLKFSTETLLEETNFGEIYVAPTGSPANIYVTGLKVATEENFLFSYNITNTTKKIRDALNRERSNVGRSAYTSRVKKILKSCTSGDVAERLVADLEQFQTGTMHDELNWKPIQIHAVKLLNAQKDVVVATGSEQYESKDLIDHAKNDGYQVVTIPDHIQADVTNATDVNGDEIRSVGKYVTEYNDSFEYTWVDESEFTPAEQRVWALKDSLLPVIDIPWEVNAIRVSETMRITAGAPENTRGTWNPDNGTIVIKREVLADEQEFIGVLLHELAHPKSGGAPDQTRQFEAALTELLGEVGLAVVAPKQ